MTRLLQPAVGVDVGLDAQGAPGWLAGPLRGRLEPLGCWVVEQDWWERPVARQYWKVLVADEVLVELFHDLNADAWFLERLYD